MPELLTLAWKPRFYDPRVASTRIRCLNPIRALRTRGYPVELFRASRQKNYRVVIYSKVYDDASFREATELKKRGVRIIFDLCDNHFYNPNSLRTLVKAKEQLKRMIGISDRVVASTPALVEVVRAELSNVPPITVISDAIETEIPKAITPWWQRSWRAVQAKRLIRAIENEGAKGPIPLIWFGIHGGPNADYGMLDLLKVRHLLEDINRRIPICLTVVSNSREKYHETIAPWTVPTRYLEWNGCTFLSVLAEHSIAIIPIAVNPFTWCKSNNRVVLALYSGLAVVADRIPSYDPFRSVICLDDWESGLTRYLESPELRMRHATMGKNLVLESWTIEQVAERWKSVIEGVLNGQDEKAF